MTHQAEPAFNCTSGPKDAKIVLVGEAWGEQEAKVGRPFIGSSGQELTRMMQEAELDRSKCLLTNVFAFRPDKNNLDTLCGKRAEVGQSYPTDLLKEFGIGTAFLRQGKYVMPEYLPEIARLREEILAFPRHLVIALGNTACWALLGTARISAMRGVVTESCLCPGLKILPTFHPAAIMRNWAQRPIVVADLMKGKREGAYPEIRRPHRQVIVNPTLAEIAEWAKRPADMYSVDVETGARQIKCIGFARSSSDALVIPFVDLTKPGGCYWETLQEEVQAWGLVQLLMQSPVPKLFQNGLYDLQYIWPMGIKPVNVLHDTMLLHHSLFPELNKGLGFLGSIYTNESAWKLMRLTKTDSEKRDE